MAITRQLQQSRDIYLTMKPGLNRKDGNYTVMHLIR